VEIHVTMLPRPRCRDRFSPSARAWYPVAGHGRIWERRAGIEAGLQPHGGPRGATPAGPSEGTAPGRRTTHARRSIYEEWASATRLARWCCGVVGGLPLALQQPPIELGIDEPKRFARVSNRARARAGRVSSDPARSAICCRRSRFKLDSAAITLSRDARNADVSKRPHSHACARCREARTAQEPTPLYAGLT